MQIAHEHPKHKMVQQAYNLQTMDLRFIFKKSGYTLMNIYKENSSRMKFMNTINIWP